LGLAFKIQSAPVSLVWKFVELGDEVEGPAALSAMVDIVSACVLDDDGSPMFADADAVRNDLTMETLSALADAVMQSHTDAIDDAKKNTDTAA